MPAYHSREFAALRSVPENSLEDYIRYMRRCINVCPMVASLDNRMERQRKLIEKILEERGIDFYEFEKTPLEKISSEEHELILLWHVLKDIDYIDNLR